MEIFYNEEDQKFYTIPDGDIATHQQIKEYYENERKNNNGRNNIQSNS